MVDKLVHAFHSVSWPTFVLILATSLTSGAVAAMGTSYSTGWDASARASAIVALKKEQSDHESRIRSLEQLRSSIASMQATMRSVQNDVRDVKHVIMDGRQPQSWQK